METMRKEEVQTIVKALQGCYRLDCREKLPMAAVIMPIALLPIPVSVCAGINHSLLSVAFLAACGFVLFGMFLTSIVTIIWTGKCIFSEGSVRFSAFPPFANWTLYTANIEAISLLKYNGVIHVQFHVRNERQPKSFIFTGRDLQAKVHKLWQIEEAGQQCDSPNTHSLSAQGVGGR